MYYRPFNYLHYDIFISIIERFLTYLDFENKEKIDHHILTIKLHTPLFEKVFSVKSIEN